MSKQRLSVHSVDTPIQNLPLRLIDPSPYAIREKRTLTLQPTVKRLGILEPIMVRKSKAGRYQVVFGDGRLKEAKALGLKTIPSILRNCNDQEALLIHLTENLARENFTPLEEAKAYALLKKELGWGARKISVFLGQRKKKSVIAQRMKLTTLPERVKAHLESGKLSVSQIELIQRTVPAKFLQEEVNDVVERGLSLEETEAYISGQEPRYKIERKETQPSLPAQPAMKPIRFVKLHELSVAGKVENRPVDEEDFEVTTRTGKRIRLFRAAREALERLSPGDDLELTLKIFAPAKPRSSDSVSETKTGVPAQ